MQYRTPIIMVNMKLVSKSVSTFIHGHAFSASIFAILLIFFFFAGKLIVTNGLNIGSNDSHIVNLYVDDQESNAPTRATTVGEFIDKAHISINEGDKIEPDIKTPIDSDNFKINIYRAKPITIIDGANEIKLLSPQRNPELIAKNAGLTTYPEDTLKITTATNFVQDYIIGEKLTIGRATPVTISLYGLPAVTYRSHVKTVGELLKEKAIIPEAGATVLPAQDTLITPNMPIFISKFGKTVATVEEPISFEIESVPDPSKSNGVTTITTPGIEGKRQVMYELTISDSKEVSRTKIHELIINYPQKQLQTRGTKPGNGISRSKGANVFTDSKGVVHRETYYDLPMAIVMQQCGAGGQYSVREDGAKVDKDGYILIAANYSIYPRCSVVETSIGLGKVYDTGGFVRVHPHGFDLATDWTNNNGR